MTNPNRHERPEEKYSDQDSRPSIKDIHERLHGDRNAGDNSPSIMKELHTELHRDHTKDVTRWPVGKILLGFLIVV